MAKIRKKRVRWNSSSDSNITGYKLYWAVGRKVSYESDFAEVGKVTEVVLPDDVLAFPLVAGDIELGITSLNKIGNESDITSLCAHLDFTVPEPPADLAVETTVEYHIA